MTERRSLVATADGTWRDGALGRLSRSLDVGEDGRDERRVFVQPRPSNPLALGLALLLTLSLCAPVGAASAPFLPEAPRCPMFPVSNVWNKPVAGLPVRADSDTLIRSIGLNAYLHPDFSSYAGGGYGIPYNVVGGGRNDDDMRQLQTLHGSDFEVVDTSSLTNG